MSLQLTIIHGIKELLFLNDYLVLPHFGGFVLKSKPSHYSSSGGLLLPASKTVSFNAQLKQNDGILAIWLQNELKCTATEAITHLNEFSEFCSSVLKAKRRLSLEGIGFFYLDFENNLCFEPQQDANFLADSFGLSPISLKELDKEVIEPKKEPVFVDRTLYEPEQIIQHQPKTRKNYNKLVTPLLISILFVSLLGLLVNNSSIKGELRSSLFGGNNSGVYTPVNYPELNVATDFSKHPSYVVDANGIAIAEFEETKKIAVKVVEINTYKKPLNNSKSNIKVYSSHVQFEIVLGCFTVLDNAKRMVNRLSLQRVNAAITGKNAKGMYVVSNGNFSTREEALSKLEEVKENFPNAWIKKGE